MCKETVVGAVAIGRLDSDDELLLSFMCNKAASKFLYVRIDIEVELCQDRNPEIFWSQFEVVVSTISIMGRLIAYPTNILLVVSCCWYFDLLQILLTRVSFLTIAMGDVRIDDMRVQILNIELGVRHLVLGGVLKSCRIQALCAIVRYEPRRR